MERLAFGLEYRNTAGEEVELYYILNDQQVYYIEEIRVVPFLKTGGAAYGYSGDVAGEYHVTVDVRKAPFMKYETANDNRCPKMCLRVNLMAVCAQIVQYIGARASLGLNRKAALPKDRYTWRLRAPF